MEKQTKNSQKTKPDVIVFFQRFSNTTNTQKQSMPLSFKIYL